MKQFLSDQTRAAVVAFAVAAAMLSVSHIAAAATVTLDGQPVTPVVTHAGNLLIPFRAPMERVGATVTYSKPTALATMARQQLVRITTGDTGATIRGNATQLTTAPELVRGVAFVPVGVLTAICGAKVIYSADRQSATVTGCTLAGLNSAANALAAATAQPIPTAAPATVNFWPWLIGLLILAALIGLIAWLLNRRQREVVTTNVYSQSGRVATGTTPGAPPTGRGTPDDPTKRP